MKYFCSFSEAIREGAKLRPQLFRGYTNGHATCAIGAGLEAILERPLTVEECLSISGLRRIVADAAFWEHYDYLRVETLSPCGCSEPAGLSEWEGGVSVSLRLDNLIVHLNNHHHWTREQIADWLESEEEKLGFVTISEAEPSVPVEVVAVS